MTKRNVEAYAAAQQPLCVQNDTIPESVSYTHLSPSWT